MRTNSEAYNQFNRASQKDLRLVIKFDFQTPLYLTSHSGIANIPAGAIEGVIRNVSSTSQRLVPDEGRSEIGSLSFDLVDADGDISSRFRSENASGEGLNGRTVQLYRGGASLDWTDFRLEQTQQIDGSVSLKNGVYSFSCADIQREMRTDLFDLAKTRLAAAFDAAATTLSVFSTSGFEACTHVASFGDQTSGTYYYLKLKYNNGFEIVRASGKTDTTFTGVVRGLFGTDDVDHALPDGSDSDSGVEVEEYVYLELPAPAMAHALLTGNIIGGGTIPSTWNLGISTSFVDESSFEDIGIDWFDSSNYAAGLIFRFQGIEKTDGKRFIEREVCLLAGAFLRVGADGVLSMRRMTGVIGSSDYVAELNVDNAIALGSAKYELKRIRNTFDISWSWVHFPGESKPRFVRRDILVDNTSIDIHGESQPLALSFKGLHNERHTYTTLINRFDALRDRYAGPPITLPVEVMPSLNDLEVGDIVRATFPSVRDYSGDGTLDRSFEIERVSVNQRTGRVSLELFGSTMQAESIADSGAGENSELPNGWYSDEGTELSTELTISSDIVTANGSLTGGTTTRPIFYYLGDLTIQSGVTLTIDGNVELRIRGHFQNNGTIVVGGGNARNTAGFLGTTMGGPELLVRDFRDVDIPPIVRGLHSAMPVLEIENDAGELVGVIPDMRGSGGANGGDVHVWNDMTDSYDLTALGGLGGEGGGSLVVVSRGAGYGVAGEVDLSGEDGAAGASGGGFDAGSGGGGAPGCLLHLLDGSAVTFPILSGKVTAAYGYSPETNSNPLTQGKSRQSPPLDLGLACARVAYVPRSRDPYPDYANDNIGSEGSDGRSVFQALIFRRASSAPSTPTGGSYNFGTGTLTPPASWSTSPPAGSDPLYVSSAQFSIVGTSGTDSSTTWTGPALFTQDGSPGSSAMNVGRMMNNLNQWFSDDAQSAPISSPWSIQSVSGPVRNTALQIVDNDNSSENLFSERMTIDRTKRHRISLWCRQPTGDRRNYLLVAFYNDAGVNLNNVSPLSDAAGWSIGTYHYWGEADNVLPTDWTNYVTEFGGGATKTIPTDAVAMAIGGLFCRDGTVGTETTIQLQDYFVVEVAEDGDDGDDGAAGDDGLSVFYAQIFRRASSAPSTPTGGSYNFGTGTLTPPASWSATPPEGSDPLYTSVAAFSVEGQTGVDSSTTWTSPALFVQDGDTGDDGVSVYHAIVYRRASSAPSTPTGGSYNFGTGVLTPPSSWSVSPPAGSDPMYASVAAFSVEGQTGVDSSTTWTTPGLFVQDGVAGDDGLSVFVAEVFRRASSAPSTPTGGSYNFGTGVLTPPSSWSLAPPAGAAPLYSSAAQFSVVGQSGTDSSTTWTTPVLRDNGGATIAALSNIALIDINIGAGAAAAGLRVGSDGNIYTYEGEGDSYSVDQAWIGNGSNSDYQVLLEPASGVTIDNPTGSAQNTWLAPTSNRDFEWIQASGDKTYDGHLRFRRVSDNLELGRLRIQVTVDDT